MLMTAENRKALTETLIITFTAKFKIAFEFVFLGNNSYLQ